MSSDILAAFLPKLLHRVPEHANAMGRHITNEDAGVARRPSAYALFCSDVSLTGVSERSTRRLNRKTPVKSAAAMQHKWQLGNMFMIIVLNFQYFGFRSFFVLPLKVLMRRCFEENLDSKSLWPPGAKVASLERRTCWKNQRYTHLPSLKLTISILKFNSMANSLAVGCPLVSIEHTGG